MTWHGLQPLCSSACVCMFPRVCMRADILLDGMRHLANYWVFKWWRRKYPLDMDNIQHVWEHTLDCVCLITCRPCLHPTGDDGDAKAHSFLPLNSATRWRQCLEQYWLGCWEVQRSHNYSWKQVASLLRETTDKQTNHSEVHGRRKKECWWWHRCGARQALDFGIKEAANQSCTLRQWRNEKMKVCKYKPNGTDRKWSG